MFSKTETKQQWTGNGSDTVFNITDFYFIDNDQITVTVYTAGVPSVQTYTTNYTLTGAGSNSGGQLTFTSGAPASGTTILAERLVSGTQQSDYENYDGTPSDLLEQDLDLAAMRSQQSQDTANRAIKVGTEVTGFDPTVPSTLTPGRSWKINSGGTGIEETSSDIDTVVSAAAASAAAALASEEASETNATNAGLSATSAAANSANSSTYAASALSSKNSVDASEANIETLAAEVLANKTAAGVSEVNAGVSETNAGISETNSSNSAAAASSSASVASAAQVATEAARDATLSAFDNFDDRYLGAKASDPALDNDGDALVGGAIYFDTTAEIMKVYTGSVWVAAYVSGTDFLAKANNLSDLTDAAAARTNLGLGAMAVKATVSLADISDMNSYTSSSAISSADTFPFYDDSIGAVRIASWSDVLSNIDSDLLGDMGVLDIATQAEAQAGVVSNKGMTPLRVAEAIAALAGSTDIVDVYADGNTSLSTTYTATATDLDVAFDFSEDAEIIVYCKGLNISAVATIQFSENNKSSWSSAFTVTQDLTPGVGNTNFEIRCRPAQGNGANYGWYIEAGSNDVAGYPYPITGGGDIEGSLPFGSVNNPITNIRINHHGATSGADSYIKAYKRRYNG